MEVDFLASAEELVTGFWPHVNAAVIPSVAVFGTALFTILRRLKSSEASIDPYFTGVALLSPPLARWAYSNRMAHVLAEMSDWPTASSKDSVASSNTRLKTSCHWM